MELEQGRKRRIYAAALTVAVLYAATVITLSVLANMDEDWAAPLFLLTMPLSFLSVLWIHDARVEPVITCSLAGALLNVAVLGWIVVAGANASARSRRGPR
jgi:hypothetical protein